MIFLKVFIFAFVFEKAYFQSPQKSNTEKATFKSRHIDSDESFYDSSDFNSSEEYSSSLEDDSPESSLEFNPFTYSFTKRYQRMAKENQNHDILNNSMNENEKFEENIPTTPKNESFEKDNDKNETKSEEKHENMNENQEIRRGKSPNRNQRNKMKVTQPSIEDTEENSEEESDYSYSSSEEDDYEDEETSSKDNSEDNFSLKKEEEKVDTSIESKKTTIKDKKYERLPKYKYSSQLHDISNKPFRGSSNKSTPLSPNSTPPNQNERLNTKPKIKDNKTRLTNENKRATITLKRTSGKTPQKKTNSSDLKFQTKKKTFEPHRPNKPENMRKGKVQKSRKNEQHVQDLNTKLDGLEANETMLSPPKNDEEDTNIHSDAEDSQSKEEEKENENEEPTIEEGSFEPIPKEDNSNSRTSIEEIIESDTSQISNEPEKHNDTIEMSVGIRESLNTTDTPSTCDNSWSYFDEPIRLSDNKTPRKKKITKWRGHLFGALGSNCGTLSLCLKPGKVTMSSWVPLLLRKNPGDKGYTSIRCGVTLISKNHAITASKCVLEENTGTLFLLLGSFNFSDEDHEGVLREVETIVLVGEDLKLAVLVFEDLKLMTHARPVCISELEWIKEEREIMKTVVWDWSLEKLDKSNAPVFESFCFTTKRNDKKMATLIQAKNCPQVKNNSSICMRTKTTSSWKDNHTIPGLPLLIMRQGTWFLKGVTIDREKGETSNKNTKKKVTQIVFEDIEQYLPDLSVILMHIK